MWEHFLIRLGFRNIYQGGQITGFQFKIHIPYYRGIWVSMMSSGFSVNVDGKDYSLDNVSLKFGDRVTPWSQVDKAYDIFWPYGTDCTVLVDSPGGLTVGMHKVECGLSVRKSYLNLDPDPEGYYDWTKMGGGAPTQAAAPKGAAAPYDPMFALQKCSLEMDLVM